MNISQQSPQGPDRPNSPRDLGRANRNLINEGGKQVERAREASARKVSDQVEQVRSARDNTQQRISTDRIDLSATARSFGGEQTAAQRAERVAELKELALNGKLNTPERAEESAAKILGGE